MMCHCPELGSASDWSYHVGNLIQPIRNTTQICVVMHHQYGISALVSQTSFGRETSGTVVASPNVGCFGPFPEGGKGYVYQIKLKIPT